MLSVSGSQQQVFSCRRVIIVFGQTRINIRALVVHPGIGYFCIPSLRNIYNVLFVYGIANSLPENHVL